MGMGNVSRYSGSGEERYDDMKDWMGARDDRSFLGHDSRYRLDDGMRRAGAGMSLRTGMAQGGRGFDDWERFEHFDDGR